MNQSTAMHHATTSAFLSYDSYLGAVEWVKIVVQLVSRVHGLNLEFPHREVAFSNSIVQIVRCVAAFAVQLWRQELQNIHSHTRRPWGTTVPGVGLATHRYTHLILYASEQNLPQNICQPMDPLLIISAQQSGNSASKMPGMSCFLLPSRTDVLFELLIIPIIWDRRMLYQFWHTCQGGTSML